MNSAKADLYITEEHETSLAVREVEGLGTVQVIAPEVLARRDALVARRKALGPVTPANLVEADKLLGEMTRHDNDVETRRVTLKSPFFSACKFIDESAADARLRRKREDGPDPFAVEITMVRKAAEKRIADEARERQRIAEEAERKRVAAEREAEEAARVIAELEATATAADAPVLEELRADAHQRATVAQAEVLEAGGRAWLASAQAESAVLPKIGAGIKRVWKCRVVDLSKVPTSINDIPMVEPIMARLTEQCRAGNVPAGCVWEEVDEVTRGRR